MSKFSKWNFDDYCIQFLISKMVPFFFSIYGRGSCKQLESRPFMSFITEFECSTTLVNCAHVYDNMDRLLTSYVNSLIAWGFMKYGSLQYFPYY